MEIFGFHSAKGGAGKTLLAVNFAKALACQGSKVLLLEADFNMPSFAYLFDVAHDTCLNDFLYGVEDFSHVIFSTTNENLDIVFNDIIPSQKHNVEAEDQKWYFDNRKRLMNNLYSLSYDVVIFDFAPGISYFTLTILPKLSRIFLISRPDIISYNGTKNLLDNIYTKAYEVVNSQLYIVLNQIPAHREATEIIHKWKDYLLETYSFVNDIFLIPYFGETVYYSIHNMMKLPADNDTVRQIGAILHAIL